MKFLRMLAFAAFAAALLVLVVAGTASATTLTGSGGSALGTGTELKAENEGTLVLDPPIGSIECKKSSLGGKTTNAGGEGVAVSANVETLSFTECNATVTVLAKGSLSITGTGSNNGTLSSTGAEVTVEFIGTHCIFKTNSTSLGTVTGSATTGGNATLDISATIPRVGGRSGAFCGSSAPWTGSYKFTTPSTLNIDGGGGGGGKTSTSLTTSLSGESKSGEEITVNEGSKAKDTATLSGTNAGKATGTVKYKVYADKECKELVTSAGEVTVTGGSVPASEEKTLEAGRVYYWQAEYSGDSSNEASKSTCGKEVLTVKASTSIATSLSGESKTGEEITVNEGSKVKDTATLSGTRSASATGKVKFKAYKDKECKELAAEAGEGSLSEGKATSEEKALEAGAVYYWQAEYAGDSLHQASTGTCGKEILTVKAKTSLTTSLSGDSKEGAEIMVAAGSKVKDQATLSGAKASATGMVKYAVYSDSGCTELATPAGEAALSSGAAPPSSEVELAVGTYYWQAQYSGDALNESSKSPCGSEILNVTDPWVASLGESYMSGEGGRWAGNVGPGAETNPIDALGAGAYFDNANTSESIPKCHRSLSAQIYIGAGVTSGVKGKNFACSGARTYSYTTGEGYFKPGIDEYNEGGNEGQVRMLEVFAQTHRVKMVVLQIGGTNFKFGDIVTRCVEDYLIWFYSYCSNDSEVLENFTVANVEAQEQQIKEAILRVASAMTRAGYSSNSYTLLIENYPAVVPRQENFRYAENSTRYLYGGCPFYNKDADWLNEALAVINESIANAVVAAGLPNTKTMDIAMAFYRRGLCETGLKQVESPETWHSEGAVDTSEWVTQIFSAPSSVYTKQESLHPNYWGQLGLRNCLRQAYNGGNPISGVCSSPYWNSTSGLNAAEEPNMYFH